VAIGEKIIQLTDDYQLVYDGDFTAVNKSGFNVYWTTDAGIDPSAVVGNVGSPLKPDGVLQNVDADSKYFIKKDPSVPYGGKFVVNKES